MPDELVSDPSLLGGLRARAEGYLRQLLAPIEIPAVASWGLPAEPPYPQRTALSALAAFPWVRACVRARCDDVGGLPLVIVRGATGTVQVTDHPFLRLLRSPSPGVTRTILLRQIEADFVLCGNAYLWLRTTGPDLYEVHRLHPEHIRADVRGGVIVGWTYGDKRLSTAEVYHVHDVSWSDDLSAIYGESAIRTLSAGLTTVRKTREFAARQAGKGRPDAVITYPQGVQLGPKGLDEVVAKWTAAMTQGQGVFAASQGATVTPMGWTAKDVDFGDLDTRVRDETLAVLRVPPTRAGVSNANFAVAKAEMRDYWGSLVVADLALIAEALTRILWATGGALDEEVRFDVSAVEALQTSYDQRQARAGFWVTVMGATPADAAAYEGFRDAPVGDEPGGQAASRPAREVDDQPSRQAAPDPLYSAIASWASTVVERAPLVEEVEVHRLAGVLAVAGVPDPDEIAATIVPLCAEIAATDPEAIPALVPALVERTRYSPAASPVP